MILAIDTGNTHTVIGCMEMNGEIEHIMRIESNPYKTEYEYAANMKLILELNSVDLQKIEGAVISSVVPPLTVILKKAVKLITGLDALVVGAGVKTGLPIMIDDPGTIASDLVATAVAAATGNSSTRSAPPSSAISVLRYLSTIAGAPR